MTHDTARQCPRIPRRRAGSHTYSMKTAISVPDRIFAEADRLAKRLKKSRSQVYTEAVAEYVARHDEDQVTERVNAALDAIASRVRIPRWPKRSIGFFETSSGSRRARGRLLG